EDHHYGHYRAETIASLFVAFIMATIGIQVIIDTVQKLLAAETDPPGMLAAWVALGGAVVMYIVYIYNLRLSKKISSSSLYAASQENRSDTLVGMCYSIDIISTRFRLSWLDTLAGFIVFIIICKSSWDILKPSTHTLTEGFDEKKIQKIKTCVAKVPEVKKFG